MKEHFRQRSQPDEDLRTSVPLCFPSWWTQSIKIWTSYFSDPLWPPEDVAWLLMMRPEALSGCEVSTNRREGADRGSFFQLL